MYISNDFTFWQMIINRSVADICPHYRISGESERAIRSQNIPRNSSCEVYITTKDKTKIVHLRFSALLLSPGDDVTIYDPSNGTVIAKYNQSGKTPVFLKRDSVRVVFTSADSPSAVGRQFVLIYRALSPGINIFMTIKICSFGRITKLVLFNVLTTFNTEIHSNSRYLLISLLFRKHRYFTSVVLTFKQIHFDNSCPFNWQKIF